MLTNPTLDKLQRLRLTGMYDAYRERYDRVLRSLLRIDLLIIDDWGTALLTDEERRDLFEIVEDRYDRRSTLIAAQLPVEHWHDIIGDPTLADAILDRLIHNAHTITLKGESMRKRTPT